MNGRDDESIPHEAYDAMIARLECSAIEHEEAAYALECAADDDDIGRLHRIAFLHGAAARHFRARADRALAQYMRQTRTHQSKIP